MDDGLQRSPWGTFTDEQVWQFTNVIENIEVIVLPAAGSCGGGRDASASISAFSAGRPLHSASA